MYSRSTRSLDMKKHYPCVVADVMIGTGVTETPLFVPMTSTMPRPDVTETSDWIIKHVVWSCPGSRSRGVQRAYAVLEHHCD